MALDTLVIFGDEFDDVTGIKAKDDNDQTLTYVRPQGNLAITQNTQSTDVTDYATVSVNVSGGGGNNDFRDLIQRTIVSSTLPNDITTIGQHAFANCTSLTSITMPNGVTTIDSSAFNGCSSLASVTFSNSLEIINSSAFAKCESLEITTLPSSLTSIGASAFTSCISIINLSCDGVITALGNAAFNGGTGFTMRLKSVSFPNMDISSIGSAFGGATYGCKVLEFADLGKTQSIAASAFSSCYALQTLILRRTNAICTLGNVSAFSDTPMRGYNSLTGTVYVPSSLIATYKSANNWSTLFNNGTVSFIAIEGSPYEL